MDEIEDDLWDSLGHWMTLVLHDCGHHDWTLSDNRMTARFECFKVVLTRKGEVIRASVPQYDGKAE
jgi:hypothetical protein